MATKVEYTPFGERSRRGRTKKPARKPMKFTEGKFEKTKKDKSARELAYESLKRELSKPELQQSEERVYNLAHSVAQLKTLPYMNMKMLAVALIIYNKMNVSKIPYEILDSEPAPDTESDTEAESESEAEVRPKPKPEPGKLPPPPIFDINVVREYVDALIQPEPQYRQYIRSIVPDRERYKRYIKKDSRDPDQDIRDNIDRQLRYVRYLNEFMDPFMDYLIKEKEQRTRVREPTESKIELTVEEKMRRNRAELLTYLRTIYLDEREREIASAGYELVEPAAAVEGLIQRQ